MNLVDLLIALAGAPSLPGARCRGRHHMFDPAGAHEDPTVVDQRHAQALGLCALCPSLAHCRDWLDSLPERKKPLGVIAGQLRAPNPIGRPKGTP
jgi:hypothetical protein